MTGMATAPDEKPLPGGNVSASVVRVGDTVRRPAGFWSRSVDALLRHLNAVGYEGAPRSLGFDELGLSLRIVSSAAAQSRSGLAPGSARAVASLDGAGS
jgi:hypothetical protein